MYKFKKYTILAGLILCLLWLVIAVDHVGYFFAWLPLIGYVIGIMFPYGDKYFGRDIARFGRFLEGNGF